MTSPDGKTPAPRTSTSPTAARTAGQRVRGLGRTLGAPDVDQPDGGAHGGSESEPSR
jgi:hypothetical protein